MRIMKKIVAILAVAMMLCSILPLSAFAAAGDEFELVTDIADLQIGDQIIIFAVNDNAVLSTTQNGNNRGKVDATPNGTVITATDAMQVITVEAGSTEGTYAFNVGNGYLYAASSSKNYLRTETTLSANSSWSIAIDASGVATIKATGSNTRNWMRYNKSSSIFACYGSGQNDIAIYKLPTGEQCDHSGLTCGATCSVCGETIAHEYDSNCDATCNKCGAVRDVPSHEYSGDLDTTCNNCGEIREVVMPTDPTEIVAAAYALTSGEAFPAAVQLTGVISSVDTAYSEQYGNITVTIDVLDADGNLIEGKPIQCYRLAGDGAAVIAEGDTITVSGIIKNYNDKIEFDTGCTLVSYEQTGCDHEYEFECSTICSLCGKGERDVVCVNENPACTDGICIYCGGDVDGLGHAFDDEWDPDCNYNCGYTREVEERPEMTEATLDFSTTDQRTELSNDIQVWVNGTLILTNNKGSATSNVVDYSNPARFYKNTEIIIEYPGLSKLVIDATGLGASYLWDATLDAAGLTYTVSNQVYTITFAQPVDSITLTAANQVRAYSIAATAIKAAGECEHVYDNTCDVDCNKCGAVRVVEHAYVETVVDATCTATGTKTYTCSVCGDSYSEEIPMIPHSYVDGICSACGDELTLDTATKIESMDNLTAGIYYLSGYATGYSNGTAVEDWSSNPWHVWTGEVYNGDLVTTPYYFDETTGGFGIVSTDPYESGAQVELIAVEGKSNTYYIVYNAKYLASSVAAQSRKLALVTEPAEWVATANANGGITLSSNEVYLGTGDAASRLIRAYKAESTLKYGVVLFSVGNDEPACEHEYDNACDVDCNLCYETREVEHSVKHVEAVAATCAANGNIEYWYCDVCGMAWLDADCIQNTNLRAVVLPATGEHTYDDEYDADCNVCGEIREVPEKPVEIVYGDANGDGVIDGLDEILLAQYLAEWEVELDTAAADANGDGVIDGLDEILLAQYLAEWEVTLGPAEEPSEEPSKVFNDGNLQW